MPAIYVSNAISAEDCLVSKSLTKMHVQLQSCGSAPELEQISKYDTGKCKALIYIKCRSHDRQNQFTITDG